MGSIWERVGTVWAVFWTLLDCFFAVLNPIFFKHRSRMRSKRPFGLILDRCWGVLGNLWMDFERFWEGFGKIFYVRTPALSREAPRSVPMRGGPGPPSVLNATSPTSLLNLPWEGLHPLLRRLRVCRRVFYIPPFGRVLGHFFAFFNILFAFFAHLKSASLFGSIFIDFLPMLEGFGVDLGRILAGFFDDFSHVS